MMRCRVGNGVDVHPLVKGRTLMIGGVHIPHNYGSDGHSDGDVLIHSMADSILGALGEGDIGEHFPSSDMQYKDVSSLTFLKYINSEILGDWYVGNIDSTIILQKPIVKPYVDEMKKKIQSTMIVQPENISIKATTTDYLGFIGEKKGIAAITTCLLILD